MGCNRACRAETVRRGRWVALGLAAILVVAGIVGVWWRGRPERHLAEAARRLGTGDVEGAPSWLRLPETIPTTRDRALLLRARVALERHRPEEAVGPLNRVDPRGPYAVEAEFWKGRTLFEAGNWLGAGAWFRRVLERRPDDLEASRWLASASYALGDWRSAVEALERVTKIRPEDARAWRTLGLLYKEENAFEKARTAYESALSQDPRQPGVRLELAEILMKQGRLGEAERQLVLCRGGVPEGDRLVLEAECLRDRGEMARLRATLEGGLETFPDHPGLLGQRAALAQREGRLTEALADIGRAVEADPYQPQWLYQRGRILQALGRAREAALDSAAAAELNRATAEMSALSRRASEAPDNSEVRCRLGRLCIVLGKPDLAAYWYRAALACDPGCVDARIGLEAMGPR